MNQIVSIALILNITVSIIPRTIITSVDNVNWGGNDEQKTWHISKTYQKRFKSFGIRVRAISGETTACIQDLKMWKGKKTVAVCDWQVGESRAPAIVVLL